MRFLLLALFLIIKYSLFSQVHYPLHPSVGDTIDQLEKLDYSLFPKLDNKNFQYCLIQYDDNQYSLLVTDTNSTEKTVAINKEELVEAQKNIEKINQYYRMMEDEKNKTKETNNTVSKKRSYPIRIEGPMSEQMKKEARMHIRLREDARRRNEFEKGINPNNSLHIEFK